MAYERKSFFKDRTVAQICKLDVRPVYFINKLVDALLSITDPSAQAVGLRQPMIPQIFRSHGSTEAEAARRWFKHGFYLPLSQPETQGEALGFTRLPHEVRREDFSNLGRLEKEKLDSILGYCFRPLMGPDNRLRVVPFVAIEDGARIFTYDEWLKATNPFGQDPRFLGIVVHPYEDARKVAFEGAEIPVEISSRTKGRGKYTMKSLSMPVVDNHHKRIIAWGVNSTYEFGEEPEFARFLIRYKWAGDPAHSRAKFMMPQDVAAYYATIRHFRNADQASAATVLWDMNPFAKPSQLDATLGSRVRNNLLIFDALTKKYRRPYVAERSHIHALAVRDLGPDAVMFWDPRRARNPDPSSLGSYKWEGPKGN